jgi:hypothetical protein
MNEARISFLKVFGPYETDPFERLESIRRNVGMLINVEGPHIKATKNLTRNNETGELTEYDHNILIIVKYKTLLYGKLSAQDLSSILISIDDHVRERHNPHDWARSLGLARNLKELTDSLIPLSDFIKLLSNVISEIERGRKIHSQASEVTLIS